jgi:hypothetical protein
MTDTLRTAATLVLDAWNGRGEATMDDAIVGLSAALASPPEQAGAQGAVSQWSPGDVRAQNAAWCAGGGSFQRFDGQDHAIMSVAQWREFMLVCVKLAAPSPSAPLDQQRGQGEAAYSPLPFSTPVELWKAFKNGAKFVLHYHGKTYDVTAMEPREKVVYVQPPVMPVKVYPDGRNCESAGDAIWLELLATQPPQAPPAAPWTAARALEHLAKAAEDLLETCPGIDDGTTRCVSKLWSAIRAARNTATQPAAPVGVPSGWIDGEELKRALAVIGVVGQVDGYDVIRRASVLDIATRRLAAAPAAPETGAET